MLIATWLFAIQLAAPSDAFDVRRAVNDPCVMNTFGQLLKRGGGILGRVEAAAFLVQESDGSLTMVFWPENGVSRKAKFHGAIPQGTVAIVHTHPPEMERPSRGDLAEAKRLGLPIYVVTFWQVWVADPTSETALLIVAKTSWRPVGRNGCRPAIELTRADLRQR